jgi:hypothetical protein
MRVLQLPFDVVAGHLVAELDRKRVLVDTGSPVSFGRARSLALLDEERDVLSDVAALLTVEAIAAQIRALPADRRLAPDWSFDVLLGADLLWGHALRVDWRDHRLTFCAPDDPVTATPPDDPVARLKRLRLVVNGRVLEAVADTGAPFSYVPPGVLDGTLALGAVQDFIPADRHVFMARVHGVSATVDGMVIPDAAIAEAPPQVLLRLAAAHADAIAGNDLLSRLGTNLFDYGGPPEAASAWAR